MPGPASPTSGPDRRTVLTGAAWAVPAIVAMSSSPAHAAGSNSPYITVSTTNQQIVATGNTTITATVTSPTGTPATGAVVAFSGPSGATFSSSSATTDSNGQASTTLNLGTPWRTPGSTVTVTATSGGQSTSQPLTVLGANALATGVWSGRGNTISSTSKTFVQIELAFPSPIVQIVSSYCVLLANGTVWMRGSSSFGRLGDGSTTDRTTWGIVPNLTGVTQIATANGTSNYALRSDGSVWSWGYNGSGQLGVGDTADRSVPTQITTLAGVSQIGARRTSAYAVANGAAWSWGGNDFGQLGNGSTDNAALPTPTQVITSGVTLLAPSNSRCTALMSDGTVLAWGLSFTSSPATLPGLSGVTGLGAASRTSYARRADGSVVAWGTNRQGQQANSNTSDDFTLVRSCTGLTSGVKEVWGNGRDTGNDVGSGYAWMDDGTLRSWGLNNAGQLGDGTTTNQITPIVPTLPAGTPAVIGGSDVWHDAGVVIVKAD